MKVFIKKGEKEKPSNIIPPPLTMTPMLKEVIEILKKPKEGRKKEDLTILANILRDINVLREKNLSDREFMNLARIVKYENLGCNKSVYTYGSNGSKFYIVLKGRLIKVIPIKKDDEKHMVKQHVNQATPGRQHSVSKWQFNEGEQKKESLVFVEGPEIRARGSFGYLALVSKKPREASVITTENTHFATIDRDDYINVVVRSEERTQNELTNFIQSISCFTRCDKQSILLFQFGLAFMEVTKNQIIYKAGEKPVYIFLIREGHFGIEYDLPNNQGGTRSERCTLGKVGKGQMLGEDDVLFGQNYSTSAICTSYSAQLLGLKISDFNLWIRKHPESLEIIKHSVFLKKTRQSVVLEKYMQNKNKLNTIESRNNNREKLITLPTANSRSFNGNIRGFESFETLSDIRSSKTHFQTFQYFRNQNMLNYSKSMIQSGGKSRNKKVAETENREKKRLDISLLKQNKQSTPNLENLKMIMMEDLAIKGKQMRTPINQGLEQSPLYNSIDVGFQKRTISPRRKAKKQNSHFVGFSRNELSKSKSEVQIRGKSKNKYGSVPSESEKDLIFRNPGNLGIIENSLRELQPEPRREEEQKKIMEKKETMFSSLINLSTEQMKDGKNIYIEGNQKNILRMSKLDTLERTVESNPIIININSRPPLDTSGYHIDTLEQVMGEETLRSLQAMERKQLKHRAQSTGDSRNVLRYRGSAREIVGERKRLNRGPFHYIPSEPKKKPFAFNPFVNLQRSSQQPFLPHRGMLGFSTRKILDKKQLVLKRSHSSALKKDFEQKVEEIRSKEQEKEQGVSLDSKQYFGNNHKSTLEKYYMMNQAATCSNFNIKKKKYY